jgi:type IV conjugative transfer system protein TraL
LGCCGGGDLIMDELVAPQIPRPLNEPLKMSRFNVNEVVIFAFSLIFLWVMGSVIIGLLVGVLAVKLNRYLANTRFGDLTTKGRYWFFPHSKKKYKFLIPSYVREVIG